VLSERPSPSGSPPALGSKWSLSATIVRFELADLGRRVSIAALAERWSGRVQVLVNNAAITPRRREETPEGIERQFATNVLGYFWMITAFRNHLSRSASARIVNVASYWAGGLDLEDLELKRRGHPLHPPTARHKARSSA